VCFTQKATKRKKKKKMDILNSLVNKVDSFRGTDLEKKVKEATSEENWGASSGLKAEIARATFD